MRKWFGPAITGCDTSQKRQSLKEALPVSSCCQDLLYFHKATQVSSVGHATHCLDIEALPYSQTLQAAYLLTFATQLLM